METMWFTAAGKEMACWTRSWSAAAAVCIGLCQGRHCGSSLMLLLWTSGTNGTWLHLQGIFPHNIWVRAPLWFLSQCTASTMHLESLCDARVPTMPWASRATILMSVNWIKGWAVYTVHSLALENDDAMHFCLLQPVRKGSMPKVTRIANIFSFVPRAID